MEARAFAKEINAFFKSTSAVSGVGIEEIFHDIGCKLYDPNYVDHDEIDIEDNKNLNNEAGGSEKSNKITEEEKKIVELQHKNSIKLDRKKTKEEKQKKKCC